jgi:predicted ATPase/DNA-binding CsgD family transcriptional regulator
MSASLPSLHIPSGRHLPVSVTPFIGRQSDLDAVLELFKDPTVRLVTVLGVGGVGKTRFALELADRLQDQFQNGVVFIPLAHLSKVDEFLPFLAEKLGVQMSPSGDLQQAVLDHLNNKNILLVFDNFEHLLDEAVLVREILTVGTQVKALVTSREKLNLECETPYHLQGLDLPPTDSPQNLEDFDSIHLFIQKAKQARPGFSLNEENASAILKICHLVDGLPLGILLAAAWVEYFSPAEIAGQLCCNLDFLTHETRDGSPRHVSIRAVFASSYGRLEDHQKAVFRKLTIFRGGFNLIAAEAVVGADLRTLISLVDKSLLWRNPDSGRYDMHELLRQYADEELARVGEKDGTFLSHTRYYSEFVCRREPTMLSHLQGTALDEVQADFENIRLALYSAIEKRDYATAYKMIPALYAFCDMRTRYYEGETIFRMAMEGLAPLAGEEPSTTWALALLSWYDMRVYIEPFESYGAITAKAQSCLKAATSKQDVEGIAISHVLLGAIAEDQLDFKTAIQHYKQGMQSCPMLDDVYWINMRIGLSYLADQKYQQAIQAFQVSLQRGRETGERVKAGWSLLNLGDTLILQGKSDEAEGYLEQAYELFHEVDNIAGIMCSKYSLSRMAIKRNQLPRAQKLAEEAHQIAHQIHYNSWIERTRALLQQINPQCNPVSNNPDVETEPFSERELEVLSMLKSELNGPEIAQRLFISLNTVRYHTKNIYRKLQANNRLEAIRRAKELGL